MYKFSTNVNLGIIWLFLYIANSPLVAAQDFRSEMPDSIPIIIACYLAATAPFFSMVLSFICSLIYRGIVVKQQVAMLRLLLVIVLIISSLLIGGSGVGYATWRLVPFHQWGVMIVFFVLTLIGMLLNFGTCLLKTPDTYDPDFKHWAESEHLTIHDLVGHADVLLKFYPLGKAAHDPADPNTHPILWARATHGQRRRFLIKFDGAVQSSLERSVFMSGFGAVKRGDLLVSYSAVVAEYCDRQDSPILMKMFKRNILKVLNLRKYERLLLAQYDVYFDMVMPWSVWWFPIARINAGIRHKIWEEWRLKYQ